MAWICPWDWLGRWVWNDFVPGPGLGPASGPRLLLGPRLRYGETLDISEFSGFAHAADPFRIKEEALRNQILVIWR